MTQKRSNKTRNDNATQLLDVMDWAAVRAALKQANNNTQAILNPAPERVADIFAKRAKELARDKATLSSGPQCVLTLFESGEQSFAIESRYLRGVAPCPVITSLPGVPAYLLGVTRYKGEILAVIDHALLLNDHAASHDSGGCLLLLGEQRLEFAFLVSAVAGQWIVAQDAIKPTHEHVEDKDADATIAASLVLGLATHAGSTRATTVLNGAALLADERLYFTV